MTAEWDVVVIGAGAAGIGAGRRLAESGLRTVLLEGRSRLGGRSHTVPTALGIPVDLGCEWLHSADINPWTGIAQELGFEIDDRLPDWGGRILRHADDKAAAEWYAARDAFEDRQEQAAAQSTTDRPAADFLPVAGRWNALLGAISTWANATELERVSVKDHARYRDTGTNWRLLRGYGTLIATHAAGLDIRLDTVVEHIDHGSNPPVIRTTEGDLRAGAIIVTISSTLLAREFIAFTPPLPEKAAAAAGVPLGVANKLFLALSGGGEDFGNDHFEIGALDRVATGSYQFRPHGWPMIAAFFGGRLATELERAGAGAMASFAIDELVRLFGSSLRPRLRTLASSAWSGDPFARGSYSCALPGHADDRVLLAAPVENRLFFAGEACSVRDFGTAHGAYESGRAAAEAAIAALAGRPASRPAGQETALQSPGT